MRRPLPAAFAVLALAGGCAPGTAGAQTPALATSSPPSCRENLDSLQQRLQRNYAGYRLEIKGARRRAYERQVSALRTRADTTRGDDCFFVLKAYTGWFDDPHLFISQRGGLDTAESRRRAALVEQTGWTEERARAYLDSRGPALDPLEGIWYEGRLRMAVVRDSATRGREFVAVVLTPDTATWQPGDVRARFTGRRDGSYDATIHYANFATRRLDATIHKRLLLRLSPGIWGKEHPIHPADSGLLHPADAHRPTLQVRGRTVVVSIPSHDPTWARAFDSLITAHAADLRSAERLIVDLRGNEGGSSWMTNPLLPYIASKRKRMTPYGGGEAMMLSSPDQLAYLRRGGFGPDTSQFVRSLIARMEASPGELVPLEDPAAPPEAEPADSVIEGPARVGVLIDGGTVSAAEVLVRDALRSERATLFGENTAGALDYQSTQVVRFHPREIRWALGYPTIAASATLPRGGMRGKGMAPTVRVTWAKIEDPIGWVERRLAAGR